ncbi:Leader peptidase PppA [Polystyrenella longa]|uniref:Leader peptidase PppA n=2 Tax=Polystyrenella longa TaxID=2528007 RepID=A0A518CK34_9PLAN|nr:Leader peptidase PppA [Polystyrenella longa]
MGFLLPVLFLMGAVLGRFLNLCIDQFWRHEQLLDQLKAVCPGTTIYKQSSRRFWRKENIPIAGGLVSGSLRKKPKREAFVEILNGLLVAGLYWFMIPSGAGEDIMSSGLYSSPWGFSLPEATKLEYLTPAFWLHLWYLYLIVMIEALVVATFIDFDWQIIPDGCTVPAMIFGVLGGWMLQRAYLFPVWFQSPDTLNLWAEFLPLWMDPWLHGAAIPDWIRSDSSLPGLITSLVGWAVGGAIVWGVRIIGGWVLRREAMGFGDVILMAMIGSFIGWQASVVVFFLAPFCGAGMALFVRIFHGEAAIPYGPYLALGTVVLLFGWQYIWPGMEEFFQMGILVPILGVVMFASMALLLQMIQLTKMAFGIPLEEEITAGEWTSADQLHYFEGEQVDQNQGKWHSDQNTRWPGTESGRGRLHYEQWKRGHHWK